MAGLDVVDLRRGDAVHVNHVAANMRQRGLLAEEVSGAGHAVVQGDGLYRERVILIHHLLLLRVDGMELYTVADVVVEEQVQLCL